MHLDIRFDEAVTFFGCRSVEDVVGVHLV